MSNKTFLVFMMIAVTLVVMTVACADNRQVVIPEAERIAEPVNEQTTSQVEASQVEASQIEANEARAEEVDVVEISAPANDEQQLAEDVADVDSQNDDSQMLYYRTDISLEEARNPFRK